MASTYTTTVPFLRDRLATFDTVTGITYIVMTTPQAGLVDVFTHPTHIGRPSLAPKLAQVGGATLPEALRWIADDIDAHEPF